MGYRFPEETMNRLLNEGRILFGEDHNKIIELKVYASEFQDKLASVISLDGRLGSNEVRTLFPEVSKVFTNPKPVKLVQELASHILREDDILLDFFAGSATSSEAVWQLNSRDRGRRQFIAVQLPEPVDATTEVGRNAHQLGLTTIAEIAQERLRRSARRMEKEEAGSTCDRGFRSYKLSDTNFAKWRLTSDVVETELEQHLLSLRESADDQASQEALLTELLLKRGYPLTEQVDVFEVAGLEIHGVKDDEGEYGLLAYLNEHQKPSLNQVRALVDKAEAQIVILEDAFLGDDQLKTNLSQLCKSKGIELWTV